MIIYFKVKNYSSINKPVIINFEASGISEHQESNVITTPEASLLKSILFYGHNASGKSNLLAAIVHFRWLIVNSATELNANDDLDIEPFLLDKESEKAPSFFEMGFLIKNTRYRYGFEATNKTIVKEWLLESPRKKEYPVFLRIGQEFQIDNKRFKNSSGLAERTRKNALFLSVCSQWNVVKAEKILNWFSKITTVHGLRDELYRKSTLKCLDDEKDFNNVVELLKRADLGINNIETVDVNFNDILESTPEEFKERVQKSLENRSSTAVMFIRDVFSEGVKVGTRPFFLDKYESEGTKKFFNLLGVFIQAIREGRIIIIDEFDARLHTLLTKAIIQMFNSGNIETSAQLILACHDTSLIDRRILRRDQIYFVEKNRFGETVVASLVEYKPRKEEAFEKNYLEGKYGAIPFINGFESIYN